MLRRALRGHSYPILSGNGNLGKKGLLSCEVKAVMANPYDDEKNGYGLSLPDIYLSLRLMLARLQKAKPRPTY